MSKTESPLPQRPVLLPVIGSLGVALILLVFWVLPAEFGVDPTGFGRATGLTGLAGEESGALETTQTPPASVKQTFELLGFETMEFKLGMKEHDGLVFSWTATAPLHFDMHAEPEGAEDGFAESFAAGDDDRQQGTYQAEFDGEHGWYWANKSAEPITIELSANGFFEFTALYRDGNVQRVSTPRE
ncbi:hypothetical protein [Henriciella litoralis]|uniref:hypothetical protein n=1 Tax=Henriciella litoralis TaxID=568102 RepID=UPI000A06F3C6|nr:hypothetical protein [Henriciella litoralis]